MVPVWFRSQILSLESDSDSTQTIEILVISLDAYP